MNRPAFLLATQAPRPMNGLTWLQLSERHQHGREFNRAVVRGGFWGGRAGYRSTAVPAVKENGHLACSEFACSNHHPDEKPTDAAATAILRT